jgi:glycine/D-amino acid oxidase-like deaminating enzyme
LAYLAGVPVAGLVGCDRAGGETIAGELLSPDIAIGHRLREGWQPPDSSRPAARHRVVIVGAGISGLAAAWRLQQLGIDDFVLLELEAEPGGTARSGASRGFRYPWGAHYIPVPMRENRTLLRLLEEMKVVIGRDQQGRPQVDEQFLCREPEERVFAQGRWQSGLYPGYGASTKDIDQLRRFRGMMRSWAGKRDEQGRGLFAIPMRDGSDAIDVRKLDEQSMAAWMSAQGFDSPRLRWLVDYSCRDDYGLTLEQTSAWAGVFYFASRLRGDGSDSQAVITWPEGNGRVVRFLADRTAERIRSRHAAVSIRERNGKLQTRAWDARSETTVELISDDVIFAAPQFLASHLIEHWKPSGRSHDTFRYGGWVVANVHLTERPKESPGRQMCWDNVIVDSQSLGYVTSTHQTGLDHGATVITWYYPLLDDDPRVSRAELLRLTWEDWVRVIVSDLGKPHPDIRSLIRRIDVMRWGHAMIQPRVGFVWGGQRERACESLGRIHFAGTDLSGVALLEEAFDRGVLAAEKSARSVKDSSDASSSPAC